MKTNLVHYRTCVCNINYHVVWAVKYRKKVLTEERASFLKKQCIRIGTEKGFEVKQFEVGEMDYVHAYISAPPKHSITYIVKCLKGITARKLFEAFPELREQLWKGELWNHSYYVETVGCISDEVIQKYIENQNKQY